jgi:uracil-DNA glycosylase
MTIEEYFGGWTKVIDKTELNHVLSVLSKEYLSKSVCPNQTDVFKAFKLCPFEDLKVVFLGQDPYPQKGVATGILFGNKKEVLEEDLSPSLKIIKEAAINFEIPHNCIIFDQTLENWAKQGILMINSALTVEMNKIGSHVMLWRPFISKLLKNLSESSCSIVYVLFGKQAETFNPYINKKFNHVLKIEHPAYFARNRIKMPHYLFTEIDKKLNDIYGYSIKWYEEY